MELFSVKCIKDFLYFLSKIKEMVGTSYMGINKIIPVAMVTVL